MQNRFVSYLGVMFSAIVQQNTVLPINKYTHSKNKK